MPLALPLLLIAPFLAANAVEPGQSLSRQLGIGIGYLDEDAWRFGRYSGIDQRGPYLLLDLDFHRRSAWDDPDAQQCRVRISDLGLDSRRLELLYARPGRDRLRLSYRELPALAGPAFTPFRGVGGAQLELPSDWVGGATTAALPLLLPSLEPVDLRQDRRAVGLGYARRWSDRWRLETDFKDERKEGLLPFAGVIGSTGGNARAALLPAPVDYRSREAAAVAIYADPRQQLRIGYRVFLFENREPSLSFQNPFAGVAGWAASASHPGGFGRAALAPDNRFDQLSLAVGRDLSTATRLSADLALGRMRQDQAFLPYTINEALAATVTEALPRSDLDGRIDTLALALRLSGRPSGSLSWHTEYRLDDRNNRTARDPFVGLAADSINQDTSPTSGRRRINLPADYRDQRLRAGLAWRASRATRLSTGLEHRITERSLSARARTEDTGIDLGWQQRLGPRAALGLQLSRQHRDGASYRGEEAFVNSHTPAHVATVAGGWENVPELRQFHLADRARSRLGIRLSLSPTERLSLGIESRYLHDDYRRSEIGLTEGRIRSQALDFAWQASSEVGLHAFAAFEAYDHEQVGQSIRGNARLADQIDPARRWQLQHRDRIDTVGFGGQWRPRDGRLGLRLDWLRADSEAEFLSEVGAALSTAPLPPARTRLDGLDLRADYALRPDLRLRLRLRQERYRAQDFAFDGRPVNTLANVILLGEPTPNYRVHFLGAALTYEF